MANFDLIIFDFDGTLADTREGITEGINKTLKDHNFGFSYKPKEIDKFLGYGDVHLFLLAFKQEKLDASNMDLYNEFKKNYLVSQLETLSSYEGMKDLLLKLNENNIKIMIYSNKPYEILTKCTDILFKEVKFEGVYGNKDGFIKKPDPSYLNDYLIKNNYDFNRVLYVGDSYVDVIFANNVHIPSVVMEYGYDEVENVKKYHPTYLAKNVKNLDEIIFN